MASQSIIRPCWTGAITSPSARRKDGLHGNTLRFDSEEEEDDEDEDVDSEEYEEEVGEGKSPDVDIAEDEEVTRSTSPMPSTVMLEPCAKELVFEYRAPE